MGKGLEKKRKKKKGRPSLLDLQKRSIKQQHLLLKKHNKNLINKQTHFNNKTPINEKHLNSENPNNSSSRRSTRRNPNPNPTPSDDEPSSGPDTRKQKKLKLVNTLPSDDDDDDNDEDVEDEDLNCDLEEQVEERENVGNSDIAPVDERGKKNLRKRKIDSISCGSTSQIDVKDEKHSVAATNQTDTQEESKQDDERSTPLPDKKLLLFVLDRLQKKDTYGVFAEPVDPEELPDYHEVIANPMDFGTVRKKLDDGAYASLEQFEKDVYLISSNAMLYNAPDTIYFRQARSIQELAIKNFENLRQDSDDNQPQQKVVRRGRPPIKNVKRPPGRPPLERANSDFSEAALATPGTNTNRANNEQRRGSYMEKHGLTDSFARSLLASRNSETHGGRSTERFERADDMTGSASRGISMKHGKKQIVLDESRRNTYRQSYASASGHEPSVLMTFHAERKQLIAVGLHTEYGYARSLARYAAKLGPVAWKVASRKIERCLPNGVKFGPGWIGENETPDGKQLQQKPDNSNQPSAPASLPAPVDSSSAPTACEMSEQKPEKPQLSVASSQSIQPKLEDESTKAVSPSAGGNDTFSGASPVTSSNGARPNLIRPEYNATLSPSSMVNMLSSSTGSSRLGKSFQIHQVSSVQSRVNGVNGNYGPNFVAQMGKIIGAARSIPSNSTTVTSVADSQKSICPPSTNRSGCEEAKSLEISSSKQADDHLPNPGLHRKVGPTPPDLNVGSQSPGSSAKADSVQPDLALQL